ncbi:MAG: hypothetical protein K2J83_05415, partial [Clostridia bacterium]|nr:hypothetical protein [Clostridia bacterium]
YHDGTALRYSDMVSLATLQSVKDSNEEFASINIDAIAKNGDISISRAIEETKTSTGSAYESTYTLTVKANYFKSVDIARKFLQSLAYTPGYYLSQLKIDYGYLTLAKDATDYVSTVIVLKQQLEDLLAHYEVLIEDYGTNFVIENGKTLQSYMRNVSTFIENSSELDNLITRANLGGFLKSADCIADFETQLSQTKNDLTDAQTTLNKMLSGTASDQPTSLTAIQLQSDLVNELTRKVEYLGNYLANSDFESGADTTSQDYKDYTEAKEAYEAELAAGIATVEAFTNELQTVTSNIYTKSEAVSFTTANVLNVTGDKSVAWSFVVSFIVGLVLALIIAYAVGAVKQDKAKQKAKAEPAEDKKPAEKVEK